jgi:predicted amidohydrolase
MSAIRAAMLPCALCGLVFLTAHAAGAEDGPRTLRVAAAQPKARLIDWRLPPAAALAKTGENLVELERLVHRAGEGGCDVVCLPEDTLGLGKWEAGNPQKLGEVLPDAVRHMTERLGHAAASHHMYLVCCNDVLDDRGRVRNRAFFLSRDGKVIGHYDKVNMPVHELYKERGDAFPVFPTRDLGGVGMLICYDMVFPEAARCLALGGADVIFHPTLGGAAIGDEDISRAAFRTRAVENAVYLVVAQRGSGSMIVSPKGKILAEGKAPDELVTAEIDPSGGRDGGDAMNWQKDIRARLFRERSPAAFGRIVEPRPPVLEKLPQSISVEEAAKVASGALTVGEEKFAKADRLLREGKRDEAAAAFEQLRKDFRGSWIDRVAGERLMKIRADGPG